jgi:ribosomal protein S18 acetylase RimI-like enzyme
MAGRVIQGFFLGGRMHPMPGIAPAHAPQPSATLARAHAGPPPAAFAQRAQPVQRHGGNGNFEVDPVQLGLARGGGKPLPQSVLAKMEAAFGADFSAVRVHVGPQASRIGAIAFTTGNDLYFAPGRYQPDSAQGQQLIGHELAHVIQQRQGRVRMPGSGVAVVQDHALEAEADRLGMRAAMHRAPVQAKQAPGAPSPQQGTRLQRFAEPAGGAGVRISAPMPAGNGSYRLSASAGSASIGSVMVHTRDGGAAHITDLEVSHGHRDQGVGKMLLASAARTGMAHGKGRVSLHADDNGSGKLNRWYQSIGFAEQGARRKGQPRLEAAAIRVAGAAAQRSIAGHGPQHVAPRIQPKLAPGALRPVQRWPGAALQRSSAAPTTQSTSVTLTIGGGSYPGQTGKLKGHAEMQALDSFLTGIREGMKSDSKYDTMPNKDFAKAVFANAKVAIDKGPNVVVCQAKAVCLPCSTVLQSLGFTAGTNTVFGTAKSPAVDWGVSALVKEFMDYMGKGKKLEDAVTEGTSK